MNTKAAAGIIAVLVMLGGAYLLLREPGAPGQGAPGATTTAPTAANPAATSSPALPSSGGGAARSGQPRVIEGAPIQTTVHIELAFDRATFTSSSSYPTLSGTGTNVSSAQIMIEDATGRGLVASEVAIANGRWSYSSPIALTPGTYTVLFGTRGLTVKATLVVK